MRIALMRIAYNKEEKRRPHSPYQTWQDDGVYMRVYCTIFFIFSLSHTIFGRNNIVAERLMMITSVAFHGSSTHSIQSIADLTTQFVHGSINTTIIFDAIKIVVNTILFFHYIARLFSCVLILFSVFCSFVCFLNVSKVERIENGTTWKASSDI